MEEKAMDPFYTIHFSAMLSMINNKNGAPSPLFFFIKIKQ